jgi:hypothetical protein
MLAFKIGATGIAAKLVVHGGMICHHPIAEILCLCTKGCMQREDLTTLIRREFDTIQPGGHPSRIGFIFTVPVTHTAAHTAAHTGPHTAAHLGTIMHPHTGSTTTRLGIDLIANRPKHNEDRACQQAVLEHRTKIDS